MRAGWLFKKLYGRLPGDTDRAPMFDPDLDVEYRFDVSFVSAGEATAREAASPKRSFGGRPAA